jgi:hypothetical protein
MRWRRNPPDGTARTHRPGRFHDWVLSLPWVVERPSPVVTPGIRTFAINCEPLGIRQLWLVTGLQHGRGVAVVLPTARANDYEVQGVGRVMAPMPADHTLVGVTDNADDRILERLILDAYSTALS